MEISRRSLALAAGALLLPLPTAAQGAASLTDWIRIDAEGRVTLLLSQAEIGQGISTTLPAILADELGADWREVRVENAPVTATYANPRIRFMFTGNSESVQTYSGPLRKAGAQARTMLTEAAAARWGVPAASCTTCDGAVHHAPSGRSLGFGALAAEAAARPVPPDPALRPESELRLIGRPVQRRDIPAKVNGSARFGLDVRLPGQVYAALRTPEVPGSRPDRIEAAAALARPGVLAVIPLPEAVAVIAEHWWQARQAVEALEVTFTPAPAANLSQAELIARHEAALNQGPFGRTVERGAVEGAFSGATRRISADYTSPFQAHATMEPMNATAQIAPDGSCDVHLGTQGQQMTQLAVAGALGISPAQVRVHWTYAGGGFGRRLLADFAVEAALCAKAVGRPVQVIWTREQDMACDWFRPMTRQRLEAALDGQGLPRAIQARLVSATQLEPVAPGATRPHVDPRVTEGLEGSRYAIPNWWLDFHLMPLPIRTSVLRTTGFGPNIFALESFLDELALAAGADPWRYRQALLAQDARGRAVLDAAAEMSGWGSPLPPGQGRGIAFCEAFETVIAQVVHLAVSAAKEVRVLGVWTAADPGRVFDPGITTANLEGGVMWALTSAFHSEITFENGLAQQGNFSDYPLPFLRDTPPVMQTRLIESPSEKLGGLGEVGPVAALPAFANALAAATGTRLREMPIARAGFTPA